MAALPEVIRPLKLDKLVEMMVEDELAFFGHRDLVRRAHPEGGIIMAFIKDWKPLHQSNLDPSQALADAFLQTTENGEATMTTNLDPDNRPLMQIRFYGKNATVLPSALPSGTLLALIGWDYDDETLVRSEVSQHESRKRRKSLEWNRVMLSTDSHTARCVVVVDTDVIDAVLKEHWFSGLAALTERVRELEVQLCVAVVCFVRSWAVDVQNSTLVMSVVDFSGGARHDAHVEAEWRQPEAMMVPLEPYDIVYLSGFAASKVAENAVKLTGRMYDGARMAFFYGRCDMEDGQEPYQGPTSDLGIARVDRLRDSTTHVISEMTEERWRLLSKDEPKNYMPLSTVVSMEKCDLVGQVLAICEVEDRVVLRIWDGTMPSLASDFKQLDELLEDVNNSPYLPMIVRLLKDLTIKASLADVTADIFVHGAQNVTEAKKIAVGEYAVLRNVHAYRLPMSQEHNFLLGEHEGGLLSAAPMSLPKVLQTRARCEPLARSWSWFDERMTELVYETRQARVERRKSQAAAAGAANLPKAAPQAKQVAKPQLPKVVLPAPSGGRTSPETVFLKVKEADLTLKDPGVYDSTEDVSEY